MKKIVVMHVHYPESLTELLRSVEIINPDVFLVTYTDSRLSVESIYSKFPEAKLWLLENRGRDIFPLIVLSKQDYFQGNSIVWKIHSKESKHLLKGKAWRDDLIKAIASSPQIVREIEDLIENKSISMVGSASYMSQIHQKRYLEHRRSFDKWNKVLNLQNLMVGKNYIKGTIFACHSSVLDQLKYLPLSKEDFILESMNIPFTKIFALKLFLLNKFAFKKLEPKRIELDSLTRKASSVTYAIEAYLGYLASEKGEVIGL